MTDDKITDIPIKGSTCPVCKKPSVRRYKPFCSKHCADVDLGHWLNGKYVIEGSTDIENFSQEDEID
ncbi:MAG: DNA gyrase inhibitor YacG [Alphaproteobacteria bacterium]